MRRAVTLPEVLLVVALLSLLAALLFPVFAQAREQARAVVCLSNVKQLGLALRLYVDDYGGRYPQAGHAGRASGWVRCPAHWVIDVEGGSLFSYTRAQAVYRCPSLAGPLAFAMNAELDGVTEASVREPATLILLCEEAQVTVGRAAGPNDGVYEPPNAWDAVSARHAGFGSLLYADGHARRVRAERFRRPWGAVPGEEWVP